MATTQVETVSSGADRFNLSSGHNPFLMRIFCATPRHRSPLWGGLVAIPPSGGRRSEEHTSELQSQSNLVCRLLLEKKKWPAGLISTRLTAADQRCAVTPLVLAPS